MTRAGVGSSVVRIPPELEAFLQQPKARTLMIRGPPGSGKTMLSLALMDSFHGRRVYVSLRVARESLLVQNPWLLKLPSQVPSPEIEIVDAYEEEPDHVQDHNPRPLKDAVMASPRETKELEEFLWLPSSVQSAWSLASTQNPTMIVFDSWDAIIDQYFERVVTPGEPIPSRSEIESILVRRMAKGNVSVVLVLERDTPSTLDYHVDGIVETSRLLREGRLERWLTISKLRGVKITVDTYPFTLVDGRFTTITTTGPGTFQRINPPVPDPSPKDSGIWPGSTDYAEAFGRLLPAALTLFELDAAIPREVPRAIIGPMAIQTIQAGGRALILPPPLLEPEDAYQTVSDHLSRDAVTTRLRVMSAIPLYSRKDGAPGILIPFDRIGWTKAGPLVPVPKDPEFLQAAHESNDTNLVVAYLSGLQAMAEASGMPVSHGILPALGAAVFQGSPVHVVAMGHSGDPLLPGVIPLAQTFIKVQYTNGRVFISGYRPYLAPRILYEGNATEPYRLIPIL
jgi:KaiC/GvpD/RAD55 family RecA-like ATPase